MIGKYATIDLQNPFKLQVIGSCYTYNLSIKINDNIEAIYVNKIFLVESAILKECNVIVKILQCLI